MARARRKHRISKAIAKPAEPLVSPFAAQHGHYEEAKIVDLSGELGGKRMSMVKVMLNRGGTAVDRWIANDRVGMFGEHEQCAIRYCRNLWHRADGGLSAVDPSSDKVDAPLGWASMRPWPSYRCWKSGSRAPIGRCSRTSAVSTRRRDPQGRGWLATAVRR